MQDDQEFLALSRTFKLVDGILSADDQLALWRVSNSSEYSSERSSESGAAAGDDSFLAVGHIVDGKYRIEERLGHGGMGAVYRVQHLLLDKTMALKTFSPEGLTLDSWDRFQREAKSIAKLTHANIVQVFDFGIGKGNVPYYTMEILSGRSLSQKLHQSGRLSLSEALPIFTAVAGALAHAHKVGIVHRDIKPANIFLDQDKSGKVVTKVLDFGIAKLASTQGLENQSQTDSGLVFGSPLYMSPEQSMGKPTDQRTDIYSFGCTAFEVLTGKPPFLGKNAFDTIRMHHDVKPPHLVDVCKDVVFSSEVEALVAKMMSKDLAGRYQDFGQVLADLKIIESLPVGAQQSTKSSLLTSSQTSDNSRLLLEKTGDSEITDEITVATEIGAVKLFLPAVVALILLALISGTLFLSRADLNLFAGKSQGRPTLSGAAATSGAAPAVEEHKYYSVLSPGGGRVFYWPVETLIGRVSVNQKPSVKAVGVLTLPKNATLSLVAGEPLWTDPSLFDHFRHDDITSLDCDSHITWTRRHLEKICQNLTSLYRLDISDGDIKGDGVDLFNRLTILQELDVGGTKITGKDLVRLNRLRDLRRLHVVDLPDMSPVLEKLKGSKNMLFLYLSGCNMNSNDVANICTMSNLLDLDLKRNEITLDDVKRLTVLKHLRTLCLGGTKLGPSIVEKFPRFESLGLLEIPLTDFTTDQMIKLQARLPAGCSIKKNTDSDRMEAHLDP